MSDSKEVHMTRHVLAVTAAILFLAAVACDGASDEPDQASPPSSDTSTEIDNALEISMKDFEFTIEGEAHAGSLLVNFTNDGAQLHDAIIGKLDQGKTLEDVEKLLRGGPEGPPPPWFDDAPHDMGIVSPGETAGIVLEAEEGTYVLLCFMTDRKGVPHVAHGMMQTFEVSATQAGAQAEADQNITMSDEGLDAQELPAGASLVKVTNDADETGELAILRIEDGATMSDVEKSFEKAASPDEVPATFYGGTHAILPGDSAQFALDLEPGTYTFVISYGQGPDIRDIPTEVTVSD